MNSFSDDQSSTKIKKIIKKIKNEKKSSSSSSNSSISPIGPSTSTYHPGHRQCSSFDASLIDTSESFDTEVLKIFFALFNFVSVGKKYNCLSSYYLKSYFLENN